MSKLDALTSRQEEIIQKVLDGEEEISKRRIANLTKYCDLASVRLDEVSRKCSMLGDGFLISENEVSKKTAYKKNKNTSTESGGGDNDDGGDSGSNSNTSAQSPTGKNRTVKQTTSDEAKNELLKEPSGKNFADQIATFFKNFENDETRRNAIEDEMEVDGALPPISKADIEARQHEKELEQLQKHAELRQSILNSMMDIEIAQTEDREARITEIRLGRMNEVFKAEAASQDFVSNLISELEYANGETLAIGNKGQEINEAGDLRAQASDTRAQYEYAKKMAEDIEKYKAKRELELKRKNNGVLSKEDATRIEKEVAKKFKLDRENLKKLAAEREKQEAGKALKEELKNNLNALSSAESWEDRKQALKDLTHDADGSVNVGKAMSAALYAVSDLAKQLEGKIDEIAGYKGVIDTRLQGSSNKTSGGSYWDQLVKDMTSVGAINPFFKQETFAANIRQLVDEGIAFDLKQRAFLMTIQEKIATTFSVADGTLLRLIRIQQEDSTAGRLGMESALNAFLNNMYENTEYLKQVASSVRSSLEEMQSLMAGAEAAEVEYQVQKWLGSLYSVGMSQSATQGIADALGKIAAGQIEGLTNGGAGNLLIMAANDAGIPIADILTRGITAEETNRLLEASVKYLAELAESAKENKVVQQQLADVFGVKASDLRAATNLVLPGTTNTVAGNIMSYDNMLKRLNDMAGTMGKRTSIAEMMTNFWENGQYTLAGSMASNPVSYFIYKMAKVVDDAAGGIDLPFINVMGFGVDLNTTVSDLMRVAAVGAGILGSIGPLISGLGNSFNGRAMLEQLGISAGSGLAVTPRGSGNISSGGGGQTTSGSGYVGNASSSDIKNSTIQESKDSKKQQMIEAKEEAEANQVDILNTTVIKIYELLDDVAHGKNSLSVKVEGYGLTRAGNSGAQGGVGALGNGGSAGSALGNTNSTGSSGNLDLGGWTMA
jgi:hypothetical protein